MKFDKETMPKHIAIIMDGNRRWARAKGKPVSFGHKEGAKTLEKIVRYANKIGLEYITVYAFSTENWKRAEDEVKALMMLLQNYLDEYSKRADTENIRVKILGDITALSEGMQKSIKRCMERTKDNTGVTFNIALNYGGRDELIKAIKQISAKVKNQEIDIEEISEKLVSDNLYTKGQPDPDLLIRTSGELRFDDTDSGGRSIIKKGFPIFDDMCHFTSCHGNNRHDTRQSGRNNTARLLCRIYFLPYQTHIKAEQAVIR